MKRALFGVLLLAFGHATHAAGIDSGEAAYERCALCHGLFGNTTRAKFPKLAGQNPRYLERQIRDFLSGQRSNDGGQMSAVVTEITDSEINIVVDWFSAQDDPKPVGSGNDTGAQLYAQSECSSCHTGQRSSTELVPLLKAQHSEYLMKQMMELREGIREGGGNGLMHHQLQALRDEDIAAIAEHLASQERIR